MAFAWAMFWLMAATAVVGFVCYGAGLFLRMFRPGYRAFRYRLTLPIIAGCVGSIGAIFIMLELNNIFLIDALYHLALVRAHPDFVFISLDVVAYGFGGYYATKYALKLAHRLDDRRNASRNDQPILATTRESLRVVGRDLFKEEPNDSDVT